MNKHTANLILKQLDVLQRSIDELRHQLLGQRCSDVEFIRQEVAARYGVTVESMNCHCRQEHLVWPRHVAMWLARELCCFSLSAVAERFDRDHSTTRWAIKHVESVLKTEPNGRAVTVLALRESIRPHLTIQLEETKR